MPNWCSDGQIAHPTRCMNGAQVVYGLCTGCDPFFERPSKVCTVIPSASSVRRTDAAICTASGVSPWQQIVSIGVSIRLPLSVMMA